MQAKKSESIEEATRESLIEFKKSQDLDPLIDSLKEKRVVMLGEASHGTSEYYQLRTIISQKLIENYGFKFIAIEGDWPDAYRLHKYIQKGQGGSAQRVLMQNHRWPTWKWANEEIVRLAEWMRESKAGFYGLDVYSLFDSINEVNRYLKLHQPHLAGIVERMYSCFDPFDRNEIAYAKSLLEYPTGCKSEVLSVLRTVLQLRLEEAIGDGEDLFSSQQNAHIVASAENYYRGMLTADAQSWNTRDVHMMETLDRLLQRKGEDSKAIVWAHNTHVGDYRATNMKLGGYVNIGGLARESYGEENVALVGFGSDHGQLLAGSAWGGKEEIMPLPSAMEDSYESYFHKVARQCKLNQFYLIFNKKTHSAFAQARGHRAVGVVYNPLQDRYGNYVPTELSKRYDAFIFIDQTKALKSLHVPASLEKFPETWPSGH